MDDSLWTRLKAHSLSVRHAALVEASKLPADQRFFEEHPDGSGWRMAGVCAKKGLAAARWPSVHLRFFFENATPAVFNHVNPYGFADGLLVWMGCSKSPESAWRKTQLSDSHFSDRTLLGAIWGEEQITAHLIQALRNPHVITQHYAKSFHRSLHMETTLATRRLKADGDNPFRIQNLLNVEREQPFFHTLGHNAILNLLYSIMKQPKAWLDDERDARTLWHFLTKIQVSFPKQIEACVHHVLDAGLTLSPQEKQAAITHLDLPGTHLTARLMRDTFEHQMAPAASEIRHQRLRL